MDNKHSRKNRDVGETAMGQVERADDPVAEYDRRVKEREYYEQMAKWQSDLESLAISLDIAQKDQDGDGDGDGDGEEGKQLVPIPPPPPPPPPIIARPEPWALPTPPQPPPPRQTWRDRMQLVGLDAWWFRDPFGPFSLTLHGYAMLVSTLLLLIMFVVTFSIVMTTSDRDIPIRLRQTADDPYNDTANSPSTPVGSHKVHVEWLYWVAMLSQMLYHLYEFVCHVFYPSWHLDSLTYRQPFMRYFSELLTYPIADMALALLCGVVDVPLVVLCVGMSLMYIVFLELTEQMVVVINSSTALMRAAGLILSVFGLTMTYTAISMKLAILPNLSVINGAGSIILVLLIFQLLTRVARFALVCSMWALEDRHSGSRRSYIKPHVSAALYSFITVLSVLPAFVFLCMSSPRPVS